MKRIYIFYGLLFMLTIGVSAHAQKMVTGVVTDEKGTGIAGATIEIIRTRETVSTDSAGIFSILKVSNADQLLVSVVGFLNKTVKVDTGKRLLIEMTRAENTLDDIVVIGYGSTRRKDLTGSVASVNIPDLQKAPVASFEDALGGRVAGVQVTTTDGQPGEPPAILIRGSNTVTQESSPLYVIDGFPLESFANNTINPQDIESIEVLKDASATAIYGARGANGVILVTTKRGKVGDPVITYQNWLGISENNNKIEMMSPYEFVKYQKEFGGVTADLYNELDFYREKAGIDWQNLLFKKAKTQNHFLSVNGGNAKTRYSISSSLLNQEGAVINSGYDRYQARVVLDQTINNKLKVGVNINYTHSKTHGAIMRDSENGSATSYIMYSAWGSRPIMPNGETDDLIDQLEDPDVDPQGDYRINPVINLQNIHRAVFANTLIANAYAEYKILKDLTLRVTGGYTSSQRRAEAFFNSRTAGGSPITPLGQANGVNGSLAYFEDKNWVNENTLTYDKIFKKLHKLNIVSGVTLQENNSQTGGYTAIQLPNENLGISGLEEGTLSRALSSKLASTLASFLARANYSFDNKYLFTASFRADGSSKFPVVNRWGYFPSASAGWVISREQFMKALPVISFAKLRGGYGLTGNNRVSPFGYLSQLQLNFFSGALTTGASYPFNNTIENGAAPFNLGNSKLKWETTGQFDAGLELGLFKDRISLVVDYYNKQTYDLLINATLAPSMGYKTAFKNIGKVSNSGWEFTVNTTNINNADFKWTSSFNISFNRNKVLSLNDDQPSLGTQIGWNSNFSQTQPYMAIPGHPISMFYGYVWEGVYTLDDFITLPNGTYQLKPGIANLNNNSRPGYIKYADINGDGMISSLDYTLIGDPNPVHIGGFSNNFNYKNFDLNLFFQWSYGNEILNANRYEFEGQTGRVQLNMFASYADRWSLDNQDSKNHVVRGGGGNVYSSRVIEDGSYLRFKTMSFGYNLPDTYLRKIRLKGLRIYASGQNLLTWTNYSGLDPEVSTRPNPLSLGFDFSPYPKARTFTIGLNLKF